MKKHISYLMAIATITMTFITSCLGGSNNTQNLTEETRIESEETQKRNDWEATLKKASNFEISEINSSNLAALFEKGIYNTRANWIIWGTLQEQNHSRLEYVFDFGEDKAVAVIGTYDIVDLVGGGTSIMDCHACAPEIKLALFQKKGTGWKLLELGNVGRQGTNGKLPNLNVERLGTDYYCFVITSSYVGMGYSSEDATFYELYGQESTSESIFEEVFSYKIYESQDMDREDSEHFEHAYKINTERENINTSKPYFTLKLTTTEGRSIRGVWRDSVNVTYFERCSSTGKWKKTISYNVEPPPPPPKEEEPEVFLVVEENPEFPGGPEVMMKWINANIKYPQVAKENGITGRVYVNFVIDDKGNVTKIKILGGVDPELDAEAIRVVQSMPKWKPGKQMRKTCLCFV